MPHTAKPYAKVPTLFDRVQDELSAIEAITRVLGSLPDHETRLRVINWVSERFSQEHPGAQPETPRAVAHCRATPHADSGLSIPDDLFDPVVEAEPADLHGVFDQPAAKLHAPSVETVFDAPVEKPHPVAIPIRPPVHAFELIPPNETPAPPDLPEPAADQPERVIDRRQLNLLLLADMSTPAALKVSGARTTGEPGDSPDREPATLSPRRLNALAIIKAGEARPVKPASAGAAAAPKTTTAPTAAPHANPDAAQDSMEAMLRGLVDDFRHLADEWGNT